MDRKSRLKTAYTLGKSANLNPGDRVFALRDSMTRTIVSLLPDGGVT